MAVEIVPPGQSDGPGPEVTLEMVVLNLIEKALAGVKHIAIYQPRQDIITAVQATVAVLNRDIGE